MTGPFSRRRLSTVAAGGAALAALPVRPAFAATDEELAYANFAVSSELLLADLYGNALAAKVVTDPGQAALRNGRRAAHPACQRAFRPPHRRRPGCADRGGLRLPVAGEGVYHARRDRVDRAQSSCARCSALYQTAVVAVTEPSYRILYASLAASAGQQLGALTALAASSVVEPFPVALDLESASGALEPYLG